MMAVSNRFVDADNAAQSGTCVLKGLKDTVLYSLVDVITYAVVRHPEMVGMDFDGEVFLALDHYDTMSVADKGTLSPDQVGAIHFYTQPTIFYRILNSSLASRNEEMYLPFFPFMKLFLSGVYQRPLVPTMTVYRGINKSMLDTYPVGKSVCWWQITSTTDNLGAVSDFLGKQQKQHTIFAIKTRCLVSIAKFSAIPAEDEYILLPLTFLKVKAFLSEANMVQLEEMSSPPLLDYLHPQLQVYRFLHLSYFIIYVYILIYYV